MTDRIPSYRKKKTRNGNYGVVTLPDGLRNRRDILLGKFGSAASKQAYLKVVGEWQANGKRLPSNDAATSGDISISELVLAYWGFAEKHYRHPDGRPTSELADLKLSLRPLRELYGDTA